MCSVSEDIEELNLSDCSKEMLEELQCIKESLNVCRKCTEPAVIVLQKKDPFCKACFLSYCLHKFKAAIGKSRIVKPGSRVLLAFSGGANSSALLSLVEQALREESHKKAQFMASVLYVDETFLTPNCSENLLPERIVSRIEALKFPILFSSLEMALRENDESTLYWSTPSNLCKLSSCREKLCQALQSLKSLSAQQDYLECLRIELIRDVAAQAGYTHVFVGDCANLLAVKLLSNVAMGRGSQVSYNMCFADRRSSVTVCRPLREFSEEEISFYNDLSDISYVVPSTQNHAHSSIQQLTKKFVYGLQENFPSTIYTIFRIGSKVSSPLSSSNVLCLLCQSPKDNVQPAPCSALEALSLSAELSKNSEKKT